jgi:hypothetical protein
MSALLDFCNKYSVNEASKPTLRAFAGSLYRTVRGWSPVFKTRMALQKLVRRDHLNDHEAWECGYFSARELLKRLRAFKKLERHGYPSSFCEYEPNGPWSREEYDEKIASGELSGGGPEAWERVIDQIILGLEYIAEVADEAGNSARAHKWWTLNYGIDPYDGSNPVNVVDYWHRRTSNPDGTVTWQSKRQNELSDEDAKAQGFEKRSLEVNYELIQFADDECKTRLHLLAEYFRSLWD